MTTKIVTFNANGIRSAAKKGFFDWVQEHQPDVICIQETKANQADLLDPCFFPPDYFVTFVDAQKKGYSGVAIYSRAKPINIITELGFPESDFEGRYVEFEYEKVRIASIYFPSGSAGPHRQEVKFSFLEKIEPFLIANLNQKKPLILCGDWNIAHKEIDLKNWKSNQKNSGFLPEERAWLTKIFAMGWQDGFRLLNQEPHQYTWWSFRANARAKNVGWRIDYQVFSPSLSSYLKSVAIYPTPYYSDHAPLEAIFDFDL